MPRTEARHGRGRRVTLLAAGAFVAVAAAGTMAVAWRPSILPIPPPPRTAFAPDPVARGATLAAVGDCAVCHTAEGGQPFAGGRPLATPFGTIFTTNITPDPDSGIGAWPEAAFSRAMREGVGRDGRHLYPALPYTHFTRATDADIAGLYAFLMTRTPVQATAPPPRLPFPLNVRATLAGWNLLFLDPGPWQPDPTHDAEWNRGAYLVEGVGHCGACHTPRNGLGAERSGRALAGGEADGWHAPALDATSPARIAWTVDALTTYLHTGFDGNHGAAAGPMGPVTQNLARVPEADVRAIALYIAAQNPAAAGSDTQPARPAERAVAGDPVFAGACGGCHAADAPMTRAGAPSLALSTAVNAPTSRNTVNVVLHGIPFREGVPAPFMPGFGASLSNEQVAGVVRYLRQRFSDRPAWTDVDEQVRQARQEGTQG